MRPERLRRLREKAGITQLELAADLDISESQVLRYEKGDSAPRGDVIVKLADYFAVSADYLLGISDEPGTYVRSDLKPKETEAINAWRRGERFEAIKVIVEDE